MGLRLDLVDKLLVQRFHLLEFEIGLCGGSEVRLDGHNGGTQVRSLK